jgi:hypothetical protein
MNGNGDQESGYWEGASNTVQNRFIDALDEIKQTGFEFDDDFGFNWRVAAENFNASTLWKVFGLAQILSREQPITVRGGMYRSIPTVVPDNSDISYDCTGRLILKMRRLGLIPYNWISDSTRRRLKPSSWSGLADFSETVRDAYRKDLWERQPYYIEFFVEKDAMAGVIEPITEQYDVTLNVIRGDCSETLVYRIAEIWKQIEKPIMGYYLGDHDPKGLSIESSLLKRLRGFGVNPALWRRLAITPEDFRNPDLLGFPVKKNPKTKSNWGPYLDRFGDRCVEVDAVPANDIRARIEQSILAHIDQHEWNVLQTIEQEEKRDLFSKLAIKSRRVKSN